MKIRTSMYWIVFTMIVVPFLIFTLLIMHIYSDRLEKVITESLHVVADAQIAEMTNFCEEQRNYLMMIGGADVSRAAMRGELDEDTLQYFDNILYSYVEESEYLESIALIDTTQRIAACSEEHDSMARNGMDILIENLGEAEFFISDIMHDKQGEKTLVAVSKIENDGGETLGYVLAEINLDFYKSIREQVELWNESTFYLLDGQKEIISAGTPDEDRDTFVTTIQEREDYNRKYHAIDFENNPRGNFQYKVGGRSYITYYSDVEYTSWRIMLSINMDQYETERVVYFTLGGFLVALCIILAIWIGWFASKRIIFPIKRISDVLKEIREKHDYGLRTSVAWKDELGDLAREINELVEFIETENLYKARKQRLLQEKAEQDALTKVLNKERIMQYLQEALEHHRAKCSPLAVLFVDVDDFKAFNTNYGHIVGDQVLLFLAALLGRETKGTVGRMGGDEFLVVVENSETIQELEQCLIKIRILADEKFVVRGSEVQLPVTCCIGAVWVDFLALGDIQPTNEQLVSMADSAMYQVKNRGKHGHTVWDFSQKRMELNTKNNN